jgi:hypothetical protein
VETYREARARSGPTLIEVRTEREESLAVRRRLLEALSAELQG